MDVIDVCINLRQKTIMTGLDKKPYAVRISSIRCEDLCLHAPDRYLAPVYGFFVLEYLLVPRATFGAIEDHKMAAGSSAPLHVGIKLLQTLGDCMI